MLHWVLRKFICDGQEVTTCDGSIVMSQDRRGTHQLIQVYDGPMELDAAIELVELRYRSLSNVAHYFTCPQDQLELFGLEVPLPPQLEPNAIMTRRWAEDLINTVVWGAESGCTSRPLESKNLSE